MLASAGAKSGSEIFISVTGPYFAAASRIFAASPISTITRSAGRGKASAVTAAVSARSTFASAGRVAFDVVLAEAVELEVGERRGPVRRGFELQRVLAEHIGARGFEHLGRKRVVLQLLERLEREVERLARCSRSA